ncbi:cytochrome b5-like heme/steroid binding domain-containing protein [Limtongia smithiae]|uniref:cytochrome b5-like heme/steroid binding domain-containing protein n=1 Tax=Limtongia smithiae TaxID=1125753 RepID=UPI0034CE9B06
MNLTAVGNMASRYRRPAPPLVRLTEAEVNRAKPPSSPPALAREQLEEQNSSTLVDVLRVFTTVVIINFLLSYYITDTFFWGQDSLLLRPRYLQLLFLRGVHSTPLPSTIHSALIKYTPSLSLASSPIFAFQYPRIFNEAELALYNGSDRSLPVFLAINGSVFDVSESRLTYGPGGPYHHFAGRDATRAFVTGCFTSDLTHDMRGLDPETSSKDVAGWESFFRNSKKYWYIGEVEHPPITGPVPGPCQKAKYRKVH